MRRADRLFQIVHFLRVRRLTTAHWLAERLAVSERTIYRDIQDLSLSGVPVEGEAGVGYVLRQGYQVPPLMFTPGEIEALVVGARMVRAWAGSGLAREAEEALQKIEAVLPERLKKELEAPRMFAPDFHTDQMLGGRLDALREAAREKQIVHMQYTRADGEHSERDVRPLGLFFWGHVWSMAGWCELRGDFRNFRIDRIRQMEVTARRFEETPEISLAALLAMYRREAESET